MPVYSVCFDVCATAPFDARRLRCQAMRFDVCSKHAKDPKKVQLRNQQCRFPFITELKSPEISYTSTPSLLPTHDFPAVSIPIHYSFVTLHYSFVTRNRGGLSAHSIS